MNGRADVKYQSIPRSTIRQIIGWNVGIRCSKRSLLSMFHSFPRFHCLPLCDAYSPLDYYYWLKVLFLGLYVSAEGLPIQGPVITSEWIHDDGAANSYHKTYASCQWSDSMACAGAPVRCVISDMIELIIQLHQPCRDAHRATGRHVMQCPAADVLVACNLELHTCGRPCKFPFTRNDI